MTPTLEFAGDIIVHVGEPITIGHTTIGVRRVVPILGGQIVGPRIQGSILQAGADYQVIRDDGFTTLDARYVAIMDDGSALYIVNEGVRFGAPEVMARITAGLAVPPEEVYFRTQPRFETESDCYAWLTLPLFVAAGIRFPDHVELKVFEVR